jgi:hypothetical protein
MLIEGWCAITTGWTAAFARSAEDFVMSLGKYSARDAGKKIRVRRRRAKQKRELTAISAA